MDEEGDQDDRRAALCFLMPELACMVLDRLDPGSLGHCLALRVFCRLDGEVERWRRAAQRCMGTKKRTLVAQGDVDALEWLHRTRTARFVFNDMTSAAKGGHLDALKWLWTHARGGYPCNILYHAAQNDDTDMARWICDEVGPSADEARAAIDAAAIGGHLGMVHYLCDRLNAGGSPKAMFGAVARGHMAVFDYLYAKSPADAHELGGIFAPTSEAPDCYEVEFVDVGRLMVPLDDRVGLLDAACLSGRPDVVARMWNHHLGPITHSLLLCAVLGGSEEITRFVLAHAGAESAPRRCASTLAGCAMVERHRAPINPWPQRYEVRYAFAMGSVPVASLLANAFPEAAKKVETRWVVHSGAIEMLDFYRSVVGDDAYSERKHGLWAAAASADHAALVARLFDDGARPSLRSILFSIDCGNYEAVRLLLCRDPDCITSDAMCMLLCSGNREIVEYIGRKHPRLLAQCVPRLKIRTAVGASSIIMRPAVRHMPLDFAASVAVSPDDIRYLMHAAIASNRADIVDMLLGAKWEPHVEAQRPCAIQVSRLHGAKRLAVDVLDRVYRTKGTFGPDGAGFLPTYAAQRGRTDLLTWLLDSGLLDAARKDHMATALAEAVHSGKRRAAKLLWERGARLNDDVPGHCRVCIGRPRACHLATETWIRKKVADKSHNQE